MSRASEQRAGGDENGGIDWKMRQTEVVAMAKGISQVYNVVPSYTEIKSMVAIQVSHTTEQLGVK